MDYTQLEEDLISDFGLCLRARKTSSGCFLIGVGNKITTNRTEPPSISLARAGELLSEGIMKALNEVCTLFGYEFFDSIHDSIQRSLITIAFSANLEEIPEFTTAIKTMNWEQANIEFLKTDFAKSHPRRADRISNALLQGDKLWQ